MNIDRKKIAIIGLGYVGLPLAVAFAKKYKVVGFDINDRRICDLMKGLDRTSEIANDMLLEVLDSENSNNAGLFLTSNNDYLRDCAIYIVTVPTPVNKHNRPDLRPMRLATAMIASLLKRGDVVIFESTVYPGVTEEEMVPILENGSGLLFNQDFFCGYSPERINPGDKVHTVTNIIKVTSGSTPEAANIIDDLYSSVIKAGTYKATSIKVAEAAKVIENSQRDINIAFVNELSKIFRKIGIDTNEVLAAAGTKWNFLNFKPGLVGGHCIGVDPYYLAQKAEEMGYHPEIILAGRRMNDSMGAHVADEIVKLMVKKDVTLKNARCLILGFTFKENCPDIRNTRVIDIVKELITYHITPIIFDPWADPAEVQHEYGVEITNKLPEEKFESIVLAVAHDEFKGMEIPSFLKENGVVFDVKGVLPKSLIDARL